MLLAPKNVLVIPHFQKALKLTERSNYMYEKNVVRFQKALRAVKVIKDQTEFRN